ncbi:MAG: intradiol ring-cleavage dioxygenase [Chloroflexota bacterium]|nr:intradiol ring-cleavage dioxygenase [Chloroflexota bacterium]
MTIQPQDDDAPVGRVLTRREVLTLLGAGTGVALLAACVPGALTGSSLSPSASASASLPAASASGQAAAIPSCIVRPELTEGPYYVDEGLNRSDIRSDPASGNVRQGAGLALAFAVSRINGSSCTPFEGAIVDVWHCDALGTYSDVQDPSGSTVGQKFLRGYQLTNAAGMAAFTTIYPGWYSGRAVHIHFKVRTEPASGSGLEFTSQLFLDDSLTDTVHQRDPYASKGQRDTRNADDGIFGSGGDQLSLNVRQAGDGYAATFEIGVQVA